MIDRFERFSYAISEVSRCWHRIAGEAMASYGLSGPFSVYFTVLSRCPEGMTAARLGELCGRDKADVSRAMTALVQKGLVIREGKAYRALLRLTPAGMTVAQEVTGKANAAVAYASRGLPEEKRQIFYEALELIAANLQTLSQTGLPGEERQV